MKKHTSDIVKFFNNNYDTNNSIVIEYLNWYIHTSHRICSRKMDGAYICYQPSFPDEVVESYSVYYDDTMKCNHKSGRVVLYFTNGTMEEVGIYKFKSFLRRHKSLFDSNKYVSATYPKVEAYSQQTFDDICSANGWNDSTVEKLDDKAFISIIDSESVQEYFEYTEHWFKRNHPNVLNLEFDDVEKDAEISHVITESQAKKIVDFIEANLGKQIFVHCQAGISRSGAVCRYIMSNYDYYKDSEGGKHIMPNAEVLRKLNNVLWQRHFSENN